MYKIILRGQVYACSLALTFPQEERNGRKYEEKRQFFQKYRYTFRGNVYNENNRSRFKNTSDKYDGRRGNGIFFHRVQLF